MSNQSPHSEALHASAKAATECAGIRLAALSIGYRQGRGAARLVADSLDAEAQSGRLTCLIGSNGIGKSTLLRTVAGFQRPISGCVWIGGEDVSAMSARHRAEKVAVVLTDRPDTVCMTVGEMVATGRTPYTDYWGRLSADDHHIVDRSMCLVGIEGMARRAVSTLSDGERQKVMIAKALAQQTPAIVLDEPTAFLDFHSRVETLRLLRRLAHEENKTVLLSTHDLELALQLADCLWVMERGAFATGVPSQLATDGTLERFVNGSGLVLDTDGMHINITR